jgi:dipeptidyl aminopeptidase/acylaminoacyl peptidase
MRKLPAIVLLLLSLPALAESPAWRAGASPARTEEQKADVRPVEQALRLLASTTRFQQVAIAPDGTRVAWVENKRQDGTRGNGIYVAELTPRGKPRLITATSEGGWEDQIAWSPDSRQIAFLSNAASAGQQQLYIADLNCKTGSCTRKLTSLTGYLSSPAWSPDGKSIALLFIENSPRAAGPLQPTTPPSGVIEERIYEQRLNVVDVAKGSVRALSPPDMYVYEYDWMPDGRGFAVIAAHGDGDNNWWIAQLYSLGADGQMKALYQPKLQIANPRVSPDGRFVAFISGLMSDQGVAGGDVFVVSTRDGQARNLTPNMPASATWLAWSNATQVLFSELIDGNSGIASVDISGALTQIWSGPELITATANEVSLSLARDGRQSAMVRSSGQDPPSVWGGPIGAWTRLMNEGRKVHPLWGELRSIHWQSDNFHVQGWLLFPHNYDPSKRYPLLVQVHGGPASACLPGWPSANEAPFAAEGYFVLCPNPRGSFGQGESFTQANVKDFGGGDFRDIMAGVEQVMREFPIDPQQIGIKGWSYGGYMAMWAETQTARFAAAVAGAGVSNWVSYYGQNSIDQWMIPYFGASVYEDPAVYAKSQPINFVKNVKTPTLILVGDRDGECPAPQSFEWWHALKTLRVPVQLVVYPNEGHAIQQSEHRRDVIMRTLNWFDKYLRGKQDSALAATQF